MQPAFERLSPRPRRCVRGEGEFVLGAAGTYSVECAPDEAQPAVRSLQDALGAGWRAAPHAGLATIRFLRVGALEGPQSYRLRVAPDGVLAEATDRAGLFYAAVTLAQLARLSNGRLPACAIDDAPDFPARGVMLDISRDKVPTMATLFGLVDRLAGLKINQLQLYTEHAFAYSGHEEVWGRSSPVTGEEMRALDAYCRGRCVELVPNQNSFGHLERWLALPRYQGLAELPQGGAPLPWGGVHEKPTSLCPTDPRSMAFLAGLYDELLPNFTSRLFNVGCDETFDLRGEGRSRERVKQVGEGRVYLEFLQKIHALVSARGRRMAFWGDIIIHHPELVPEIPPDAVALEWGYEADHPFDAHGAKFSAARVPFYVCPGTSSWNSLSGRTQNMLENLRSAAENGLKHGACGYLITDWGDGGHWQPLGVSFAAFTYGASLSWCLEANRGIDVAQASDAHLTEGLGRVLLELGDVYRLCGALRGNGTELFYILSKPASRPVLPGVTGATLRAALARVEALAAEVPPGGSALAQEARHVAALLRAACRRGIALLDGGLHAPETRRALAEETDALIAEHERVWRLRNREGGLSDSSARLLRIRQEYGA